MSHSVICISSLDGTGAPAVSPLVAITLGYRLIDEDIVMRAALEAGVDREVVADVEKRKSLVLRVIEGMGSAGLAMGYAVPVDGPVQAGPADGQLRGLIISVIEETAASGSAVIVAHAASLALGDHADVFRVLLTGSQEARERRLMAERGIDASEAVKTVKRGDAGRADYIKRFYGVSEELPTLYDLVINTDRFSAEGAAAVIVNAASGGT